VTKHANKSRHKAHSVSEFPLPVAFALVKRFIFGMAKALKVALTCNRLWEEENQLDATQCFTELVLCSTCFGHVYAHHRELATVLLVWHVACSSWLLVVGMSGAGQRAMRLG